MRRKIASAERQWLVEWLQLRIGLPWFKPVGVNFLTNFLTWTQSQRQVFGSVGGVTWSHRFSLRRFFFSCARENCALSEYPSGVDWFNDIFETRARVWPGTPRKMMKPPQSPKQVFGSVRGVTWSHRFSLRRFFFSCARESCALSEYPRGVNWYNDIFETRARFWPGSPRIMILILILISGGQRIPGDQRHVFLWTVKTLHGANLNNQCTKKRYSAVSQSK